MMYNELLHSFIVVMYRLHDTLKKDHLHVYLTEKSFTSMPSWRTVSKTLRKSANLAYTCSFLLPVFTYLSTKHFTTNKWSAAIDFCWNAD